MNSNRIKEIHKQTAYPESVSVGQALLKVWNECEQEYGEKLKRCEDLLQESVIQLQYLNDKFGETGTTNQLLSKLISQLKDND